MIGTLKTTSKKTDPLVGSGVLADWVIVAVGTVVSHVTVIDSDEARLGFPARSVVAPAGTETTTVPAVVIPDTSTWKTWLLDSGSTTACRVPPAVEPAKEMSLPVIG